MDLIRVSFVNVHSEICYWQFKIIGQYSDFNYFFTLTNQKVQKLLMNPMSPRAIEKN